MPRILGSLQRQPFCPGLQCPSEHPWKTMHLGQDIDSDFVCRASSNMCVFDKDIGRGNPSSSSGSPKTILNSSGLRCKMGDRTFWERQHLHYIVAHSRSTVILTAPFVKVPFSNSPWFSMANTYCLQCSSVRWQPSSAWFVLKGCAAPWDSDPPHKSPGTVRHLTLDNPYPCNKGANLHTLSEEGGAQRRYRTNDIGQSPLDSRSMGCKYNRGQNYYKNKHFKQNF